MRERGEASNAHISNTTYQNYSQKKPRIRGFRHFEDALPPTPESPGAMHACPCTSSDSSNMQSTLLMRPLTSRVGVACGGDLTSCTNETREGRAASNLEVDVITGEGIGRACSQTKPNRMEKSCYR